MTFASRDTGDATFEGRIITADPPRLLEFMWGNDQLRFEPQPDGDATVLTLTDTFDEYGKAARDGMRASAGWSTRSTARRRPPTRSPTGAR